MTTTGTISMKPAELERLAEEFSTNPKYFHIYFGNSDPNWRDYMGWTKGDLSHHPAFHRMDNSSYSIFLNPKYLDQKIVSFWKDTNAKGDNSWNESEKLHSEKERLRGELNGLYCQWFGKYKNKDEIAELSSRIDHLSREEKKFRAESKRINNDMNQCRGYKFTGPILTREEVWPYEELCEHSFSYDNFGQSEEVKTVKNIPFHTARFFAYSLGPSIFHEMHYSPKLFWDHRPNHFVSYGLIAPLPKDFKQALIAKDPLAEDLLRIHYRPEILMSIFKKVFPSLAIGSDQLTIDPKYKPIPTRGLLVQDLVPKFIPKNQKD